jgi:hypothetical protein
MKIHEIITESKSDIPSLIKKLNLSGFGGDCPEAAILINKRVFQGKGKIMGAFNKPMLEYGRHPLGHVAVLFDGNYWDADGRPKTLDEIESWGMLDYTDPDYEELADDYGIDWNEKTAEEIMVIQFPDDKSVLRLFHR